MGQKNHSLVIFLPHIFLLLAARSLVAFNSTIEFSISWCYAPPALLDCSPILND
jgi:hypothetical protein